MSESTNINPDDKAYYGCEKHHWGQDCPYCRIAELEAGIAFLREQIKTNEEVIDERNRQLTEMNEYIKRAAFERCVEIARVEQHKCECSANEMRERQLMNEMLTYITGAMAMQKVANAIRKEMNAQGEEIG